MESPKKLILRLSATGGVVGCTSLGVWLVSCPSEPVADSDLFSAGTFGEVVSVAACSVTAGVAGAFVAGAFVAGEVVSVVEGSVTAGAGGVFSAGVAGEMIRAFRLSSHFFSSPVNPLRTAIS